MPTPEELTTEIDRLTKEVADRDAAFGQLKATHAGELSAAGQALTDATAANADTLAATVAAYRAAAAKTVPGTPAELITGETVAEIDASLVAATALVGKIKEGLAAEAKVPPGAPARQGPSTEGLRGEARISAFLRNSQQ